MKDEHRAELDAMTPKQRFLVQLFRATFMICAVLVGVYLVAQVLAFMAKVT